MAPEYSGYRTMFQESVPLITKRKAVVAIPVPTPFGNERPPVCAPEVTVAPFAALARDEELYVSRMIRTAPEFRYNT